MRPRAAIAAVTAGLALMATGCGAEEDAGPREAAEAAPKSSDPGPIHVHGLGVNPKDRTLFIATHTGLFRVPAGERTAVRVAGRWQDTMGFTIVGRDRFLGSGHPDGREKLPPFLGLIESRDAGETWKPVSLLGKVDFHVLEAAGRRVYGFGSDFDSREPRFLASRDGGSSWRRLTPPEPLLSLAVAPGRADELIAAGQRGLHRSGDGGRTWRPVSGEPGLLAWNERAVYLVTAAGEVMGASKPEGKWRARGSIGGEPAAFEAAGEDLYAALHDGSVKLSTDGGSTWTVRSAP